jgi:hypothetical protein
MWAVDQILNGRKPPRPAPGHGHEWVTVDVEWDDVCESCGEIFLVSPAVRCTECEVTWCPQCSRK